MFAQCSDGNYFYRVGSDDNMNSTSTFSQNEAALDPANGKEMYVANNGDCTANTVSPNILIGKKYGVTSVAGTGGCNGAQYMGFDHLGRPHINFSGSSKPDNASYMSTACTFTFTMEDSTTFAISIEPETGYAQIVGQDNS